MKLNTAIFDMDGLLIDSEPLWEEAGRETLNRFNVKLTPEQYHSSTGLGTNEWVEHWFRHFSIDMQYAPEAKGAIISSAIEKIGARGRPLPGVQHIMQFFAQRQFKIGVASSSPMALIRLVIEKLDIGQYISAATSAEDLPLAKPHPQVFLNCAAALGASPVECICFEDSFNGMIAAKAARMTCVVVPAPHVHHQNRWSAADLKISSLQNFNGLLLESISQ